ncbi:tetratricopeptide repeat protein [Streptomyces sp. NPDC049970]|uniref:tetratricopeptide repeat protein n=1 Tax=Streptomyces sp. NPDC049970 TaxID=3155033 RepID=UPI00344726EC
MHDLVREYATELVHGTPRTAADDDAGEAAQKAATSLRQLLEYYTRTALAATSHLQPGVPTSGDFTDLDEALLWLDRERANLTASVAVAAASGHQNLAVNLPVILYDYLEWCGYFDDLIAVTTTACDVAHRAGESAAEAGAWNNLGIALTEVSRYDDACNAHTRAASLFASMGDHNEKGKALNGLGSALRESGRHSEAVQIHQEALAVQRTIEDIREQAAVLSNLSLDHQELENFPEACDAAEEAALLFESLGDTANQAKALCTAAYALQASGQPEKVRAVCQRVVEVSSAVGSPRDEAAILMACAELLTDLTPQQQIAFLVRAQAACERGNAQDLHAHALLRLGQAWSERVTGDKPSPISPVLQPCMKTSALTAKRPPFALCSRCADPAVRSAAA